MIIYRIFPLLFPLILLVACNTVEQSPPFVCDDITSCVEIETDEPIRIAALLVQEGEQAPYGISQVRSIELAIEDRNGELAGRPIELIIEEEICGIEGGSTGALRIVSSPEIVGVIGTQCSSAATTAAPIISESGMVMISATNTLPSLTSVGGEPGENSHQGYFRTYPNGSAIGRAAATFAYEELGVRRAASIHDRDILDEAVANEFNRNFEDLGGEITFTGIVNRGDTDMNPILTAVHESDAEFLFFPIFEPEADYVLQQARDLEEFDDIALMASTPVLSDKFIRNMGEDAVGLYFVAAKAIDTPEYDALTERITSVYGEVPQGAFYGLAFDAVNILFDAIEEVAVTADNERVYIGREQLRQYLYNVENYNGITGSFTCDQFGDCSLAQFNILQVDEPEAGLLGLESNVIYVYDPQDQ